MLITNILARTKIFAKKFVIPLFARSIDQILPSDWLLYTYLGERVREAKIPQNLVFLGAKHARKSIISIRTTNYTFFKKSLKIEGFKSFFFLLDKTYDFWTNFQSGQGEDRRDGRDKTRQTERKEDKERVRKKGGQGVYTPERGWGKIDYKHSHEKTENLNSLYCI